LTSNFVFITTILAPRGKEGILAWRKKVGEEKANYIANEAARRGTAVHKLVEQYLNNEELSDAGVLPLALFTVMKEELDKIDNIKIQEGSLYSDEYKVAGQVDCIADYDGKPCIIDFKTSTREKKEEWIENYYIQTCAYAQMFEERTGQEVNQLVILIVTQDGTVQEFVKDKKEYLPLLDSALKDWYTKNQ
jgi:genome maintenance exonuclease 1